MIIREWRARAETKAADRYPDHFRRNVLPHLREIDGFIGAHLSRRVDGERIEFLVLTQWVSMDSSRAFAGAECETAVVEPEAIAALVDFDTHVRHYEVLEEA